jgi:hypothetical protein
MSLIEAMRPALDENRKVRTMNRSDSDLNSGLSGPPN